MVNEYLRNDPLDLILTDKLNEAFFLLSGNKKCSNQLILKLLNAVKDKPVPLKNLRAFPPKIINIPTSYKCTLGCKMCSSGFQNTTSIREEKFLTHDEFNSLMPWIKESSIISFVGLGETLESPYIFDFLEKTRKKTTYLVTSGVPLKENTFFRLIECNLDYLQFSFDGNSSIGHGGGKKNYIRGFWEKIKTLQKIKHEHSGKTPKISIRVAVDKENIASLDELLNFSYEYKVNEVFLVPFVPIEQMFFDTSLFDNFNVNKNRLNQIIKIWRKKGLDVRTSIKNIFLHNANSPCMSIDNIVNFGYELDSPTVCCSSLSLPIKTQGYLPKEFWNSFPLRYLRYLHFSCEQTELPEFCKTCWTENAKNVSENYEQLTTINHEDALTLYNKASELKRIKKYLESQKGFNQLLKKPLHSSTRSSIYFHLGEIKIIKENYNEALSYMKQAVKFNYTHKRAFTYLYLLLSFHDVPTPIQRKKKVYLKWISSRK
ncbi:MAG: hypothetical protein HQK84_03900 [Nitrospinae bacterium]|nr:hypothetical protein [Nitrospinota bacterium]